MMWIVENWYLLATGVIVGVWTCLMLREFRQQPDEAQMAKVKEWLIWACVEAEKNLQSGTGQLKLREVWNMFCSVPAFEWVAKVISFDLFSSWVSVALSEVKQMIVKNDNLAEYIYGDKKAEEVEKIKEQIGG